MGLIKYIPSENINTSLIKMFEEFPITCEYSFWSLFKENSIENENTQLSFISGLDKFKEFMAIEDDNK